MKTLVLSTQTNETTKYSESLEPFGEVKLLHYDIPDGSEQVLFSKAQEFAPDLIVYIGSRWGKQPSIATLAQLQSKVAPSVHICSDAADPPWHDLLREYHDKGAFTLQVAIDGNKKWPASPAGLTLLTPVEFKHFPEVVLPHAERPIKCGFAGNTGGGPTSKRTILLCGLLEKRVLDMRVRSPLPFTYEGYCEYLTRCRVSLNIAHTGTEQTMHVKGRVIETALAGACLLENEGSPAREWFEPGIDYAEYSTIEQAVDLIEHMNNSPLIAQSMATNLRAKVRQFHSPDTFWRTILDKIGVRP